MELVIDLATGAMGSLLPKLGELLKEEYKLQKGVRKEVKSLELELRSMHAALRKVADVPHDQLDEQVKIWANEVRELSYNMEDVVDSFLVRVDGSGPATEELDGFKSLMKMANLFKKSKARHEIADAIKEIKVQVQDVAARRERYRVDDVVANPAATTSVDPRLLAMYKDHKDMVGIQEARDELIKRMATVDDDHPELSKLKILSIHGFGGLGKTSLAKAVYDELRAQFNNTAFVPVGRNPDVKKVFRDILLELDRSKYMGFNAATFDERQLIDELRALLHSNRYLIVIDDVWDTQAWEIIRCALIDSNCRSRVIMTTRILEVAMVASDVYKHKPLSHDNSEELFHLRLFGGKGKCPDYDELAETSDRILKKCAGVPLAIITIASLLSSKPREDWAAVYNSIGFGYGENKDVENTRKILLFSYYDLPCHLRTCLLYLSMFPEDYTIMKHTLIRKWVAEGFVHREVGKGLFEVGERYFNELINRSMIEAIGGKYGRTIYGCRVHDMVLDIVCWLSKEENYVIVMDSNKQQTSHVINNARRLAIQERVLGEQDPLVNMQMPHLRSFNVTGCRVNVMPSLSIFAVLRVLDMEGCTFIGDRYHLEHIGKLLQLRYLGLRGMPISELPEEIRSLTFLQTLMLAETKIMELPPCVGQLQQLKCLYAPDTNFCSDWTWIHLISLEELVLGDVSESPNFVLEQLGKLTELRRLNVMIRRLDEKLNKVLVQSLCCLHKIQELGLRIDYDEPVVISWEGFVPSPKLRHVYILMTSCRLPGWINPSLVPNLTNLMLRIETVDTEILRRMPVLTSLELLMSHSCSGWVPQLDVMQGFPELRNFYCNLAVPKFLPGAMPSLEQVLFTVRVRELKDNLLVDLDVVFSSLENLPILQSVKCYLHCSLASNVEMEEVEAAVRRAVAIHPNHPTRRLDMVHTQHPTYYELQ